MSTKTEIVVRRASYREVFSAIFQRVSFSTARGAAGGRGKAERNLSWLRRFCILRWRDRQWK